MILLLWLVGGILAVPCPDSLANWYSFDTVQDPWANALGAGTTLACAGSQRQPCVAEVAQTSVALPCAAGQGCLATLWPANETKSVTTASFFAPETVSANFSVFLWVRARSVDDGSCCPVHSQTVATFVGVGKGSMEISLGLTCDDGWLRSGLVTALGNDVSFVSTSAKVVASEWHWVGFTVDTVAYTQYASAPGGQGPLISQSIELPVGDGLVLSIGDVPWGLGALRRTGAGPPSWETPFAGHLDELLLFNQRLSEREVGALNSQLSSPPCGSVAGSTGLNAGFSSATTLAATTVPGSPGNTSSSAASLSTPASQRLVLETNPPTFLQQEPAPGDALASPNPVIFVAATLALLFGFLLAGMIWWRRRARTRRLLYRTQSQLTAGGLGASGTSLTMGAPAGAPTSTSSESSARTSVNSTDSGGGKSRRASRPSSRARSRANSTGGGRSSGSGIRSRKGNATLTKSTSKRGKSSSPSAAATGLGDRHSASQEPYETMASRAAQTTAPMENVYGSVDQLGFGAAGAAGNATGAVYALTGFELNTSGGGDASYEDMAADNNYGGFAKSPARHTGVNYGGISVSPARIDGVQLPAMGVAPVQNQNSNYMSTIGAHFGTAETSPPRAPSHAYKGLEALLSAANEGPNGNEGGSPPPQTITSNYVDINDAIK